MADRIERIGVLTGGGDAPGLNAVIRAVTKTAIHDYGWEVLGIEDSFDGFVQPGKIRPLTFDSVRGLLPRGGTILGTTNRASPFAYPVETEAGIEMVDVSDDVIKHFRVLGLDALVVIGGDGSMKLAHRFIQKGLATIVGVPKTIDNDVLETAASFGFDTAVNTAMEAIDRLHTTAESHHRVMVLEVMGRDAGWIALHAGLAGGADVILMPEIPYRVDFVADKINARNRSGAHFSILVVAEGAHPEEGEKIYGRDVGEEQRLGGIGGKLAEDLRDRCQAEVRTVVLGHLQRGGSPTAFDRLLASRYGSMAVHAIAGGQFGHMVALRHNEVVTVPLERVVRGQKFVPLDGDLVKTALSLSISLGNTREAIAALAREREAA